MQQFGSLYLMFGPWVTLGIGLYITALGSGEWVGLKRWAVLFVGPAVNLGVTLLGLVFVKSLINPVEGSGFLLGGAVLGIYVLGLVVYYPVLVLMAAFTAYNQQRGSRVKKV